MDKLFSPSPTSEMNDEGSISANAAVRSFGSLFALACKMKGTFRKALHGLDGDESGQLHGPGLSTPHASSQEATTDISSFDTSISHALCPYLRALRNQTYALEKIDVPDTAESLEALPAAQIIEGFRALQDREFAKHRLTGREADVARLILEGQSNRTIAKALFITESCVKFHINNILRKIGGHSRRDLFAIIRIGMEGSIVEDPKGDGSSRRR